MTTAAKVDIRSTVQSLKGRALLNPYDYPRATQGMPGTPVAQRILTTGLTDSDAIVTAIITFDINHHMSGWFRNSRYDRCLHLSLSAQGRRNHSLELPTEKEIDAWAQLVFGEYTRWLWRESGKTKKPVVHLRLFYDRDTMLPILPTGEVYDLVPYADGSSPEKIFRI